MFKPMLLADGLSGLNPRLGLKKGARGHRRPGKHRPRFAAEVLRLEERCMLSGINGGLGITGPVPLDAPAPGPMWAQFVIPNLQPDQSTVMSVTSLVKTVTITNDTGTKAGDTARWLYPVFEATNANVRDGQPWDPNDPANLDYRLYVGYKASNSQYYVGLPPGATVTFNVPEALWNAGTIQFVTDTPETEKYFWSNGNPFNYVSSSPTFVQTFDNSDLALLLYRGPSTTGVAGSIATAAPSQLAEYTIRDQSQSQGSDMIETSVDLDISYLDAMYLPMAQEAVLTPGNPEAGYIGTTISVDDFESTLSKFVSAASLNGANLASYFYTLPANNVGWPQFNLTASGVNTRGALVKIPGGANIFANSASSSVYKNTLPLLTSGQASAGLPATNNNYAAQTIIDLMFSWAEFYQKNYAVLPKYGIQQIPPSAQLSQFLATGPNSIQYQDNVQTFPIQVSTKPGPGDMTHALQFATLVWKAMWLFSQDNYVNPMNPQATPVVDLQPRAYSATGLTLVNNPAWGSGLNAINGASPALIAMLQKLPNGGIGTPVRAPNVPPPNPNVAANVIQGFDGNQIRLQQPAAGPGNLMTKYQFFIIGEAGHASPPAVQPSSQLIQAIFGDNIADFAHIPGSKDWNGNPLDGPDPSIYRQAVTDNVIIPLMYGAGLPQTPPYPTPPAPVNPMTGILAQYTVDPLVWLISNGKNWANGLPITAYAFSVDDSVGNIYVPTATAWEIAVGGNSMLTNDYPYTKPPTGQATLSVAGASASGYKASAAIVSAPSSANNSSAGTNIGVIDASMFASALSSTKKATQAN